MPKRPRPTNIPRMRLSREVRCYLVDQSDPAGTRNSWAGWPITDDLAPYVILRAELDGPIDPQSGYVCNIALVDALMRESGAPALREAMKAGHGAAPAVRAAFRCTASATPPGTTLVGLTVQTSPYLSFTVRSEDPSIMWLTESFEFSASHRLYNPALSPEDNAKVFGKCANPNGHGHNYVVEVSVAGTPDAAGGRVIDLGHLHAIVRQRVIDRFDHCHLNLDCPEFASLNPTVENIAVVIWQQLVAAIDPPARLARVRVWETPKTSAEYSGEPLNQH